jgi:hypothetical protein
MCEDKDAMIASAEYAIYNAIVSQQSYAKPPTPEERQQRAVQRQQTAAEHVAKILYLNWEMPNSKKLRFCTGDYVAEHCAPLARLGKKAGSKLMGHVFNEEDIHKAING